MKKGITYALAGMFLLFGFNVVHAEVIINEVELYPTENRFIELYNNGNIEIDLTGWYIQRKTQTGTSFTSLVSSTNFENKKISAKSYFLISRSSVSNADVVVGSMTLTESNVIQIKNPNGDVVNKVCWGEVNDCGSQQVVNPAEGQSVQRDQSNLYIVGAPTPKAQNYSNTEIQDTNNSNVVVYNNSSTSNTVDASSIETPQIKTKIIAKNIAFIGIPVEFKINTSGQDNNALLYGKYFINFGDGDFKEIKANNNDKFFHTFYYEGEYAVSLEYYKNYYIDIPNVSDKINIKVVPVNISISKIGDEKDFFVEISNNSNYDEDISNWVLIGKDKNFVFPKNTILLSKKKIILSPKITNFSILDKNNLKILNSQWETIFEYTPVVLSVKKSTAKSNLIENSTTNIISPRSDLGEEQNEEIKNNKTEDLQANVSQINTDNNLMYEILFFAFLGLGTSGAYFIRKRNRKTTLKGIADDFEIIDE